MYLKEKVLCAAIVMAFSSSLVPSFASAQNNTSYGRVEIATPEQIAKMAKESENAAQKLADLPPSVAVAPVKQEKSLVQINDAVQGVKEKLAKDVKSNGGLNFVSLNNQESQKATVEYVNSTGSENFYFLQENFRKYLDGAISEKLKSPVVSLAEFEVVSSIMIGAEQIVLLSFPHEKNKKQKVYGVIMVKSNLDSRGEAGSMSPESLLRTRIRNLSFEGAKFIKLIDENLAFKLKTKKEVSSISPSMFAWKNFLKFLPELKVKDLTQGSMSDADADPTYDYKQVVYIGNAALSEAEVYRQNLLRLKNAARFKSDYSLKNIASLSANNLEDISKVRLPFGNYLKNVEIIEDGDFVYGVLRFVSQEGNNLAALFRVPAQKTKIKEPQRQSNRTYETPKKEEPLDLRAYLVSKEFARVGPNVKYRVVPQNALPVASIKDVYDFGIIIQTDKSQQNNILVNGDKVFKEVRVPSMANSWNSVLINNPFFTKEYLDVVSQASFNAASGFTVSRAKPHNDEDENVAGEKLVMGQEVVDEDEYRSFTVGKNKYIIVPASSVNIKGDAKDSYLIFKTDNVKSSSIRAYLEGVDDLSLNVRVIPRAFLNKILEIQDALIFTMVFNVLPSVDRGSGVVKNNDELDKEIQDIGGFSLNSWKQVDLIYAVEIQDRKFGKKGIEFGFSVGRNHFKYFYTGNDQKMIEDMKMGRFYFKNVFYAERVDESKFKSKIS